MKQKQIKQSYDTTAEIYNSRYGDIQEEKYKAMLSDLIINQPILDHGCGTGMLQDFLNKKIFGVDISFKMLRKSKEQNIQGDVEKLPFKNNSFAAILSFTSLQNLNNIEKGLKEIKRISKKDTIIVLTILNKFIGKIKPEIEKQFDIQEIRICGEDIGFILSQKV